MATKKPATRRTPTSRKKATAVGVADKLNLFKNFTNYGLGGVVVGYLLIWTVPEIQNAFTAAIEKQAEQSREDRKTAYAHGEKAVERIATSIDGLRGTFSTVQSKTQDNQAKLITEQQRTNEILESKMGTGDFNPTLK